MVRRVNERSMRLVGTALFSQQRSASVSIGDTANFGKAALEVKINETTNRI